MEKSMEEKKRGAESCEAGLDKWSRREKKIEAEREREREREREVKDERDEENKEIESPKQGKNKAEQNKEKACVEELKNMIQEMGLQQQMMIQGLGDCVEKKIGVEMGKPKNEIKEEMRKIDERMRLKKECVRWKKE